MSEQSLNISWGTIAKIFAGVFIIYIFYLARDIVLWFLFGLAISVLLEPAIKFLRKIWIPKFLAIILIYFSIFGAVGLLIYITAPVFISEVKQLSQYMPNYLEQINPILEKLGVDAITSFNDLANLVTSNLEQSSKGVINALSILFGGISSTVLILTMAFFLSLEDGGVEKFLVAIFPKKHEERISEFFNMAQEKVAGWFGARILACLFVGIASAIVFYLFGIKYAIMLAIVAGVLNFIPYIGPLITAILVVVFAAVSSGSWFVALYALLALMAVQAIENNLLTPLLMKRLIDIPPVLVLVSLLLGAKLFGFLGAIFAVPAIGIIYEFLKETLERRREEAL